MTKGQILILLLIIALAFYYLDKPNKPEPRKANWKLVKKPKSLQSTKPTFPKSQKPDEPTEIKWPSDLPVIEFPSATWVKEPNHPEPAKFEGLNPPHSQVDEPFEPPKPPEPQPIIQATLNCPATEVSELSEAEKLQRQTQELSDYHWLLNNKTIADWHQEQKLTDAQFQVLSGLVDNEEMNTLSYFLTLLPVDYEWLLISPEFKNPTLIASWIKLGFSKEQTQDWLKIGLQPTDYALATWLANIKNLTPEETLNWADFTQLKAEFNHYGN